MFVCLFLVNIAAQKGEMEIIKDSSKQMENKESYWVNLTSCACERCKGGL